MDGGVVHEEINLSSPLGIIHGHLYWSGVNKPKCIF